VQADLIRSRNQSVSRLKGSGSKLPGLIKTSRGGSLGVPGRIFDGLKKDNTGAGGWTTIEGYHSDHRHRFYG